MKSPSHSQMLQDGQTPLSYSTLPPIERLSGIGAHHAFEGNSNYPAESYNNAEARHAARVDTVGHSSVQPWSAGPLFPCVIAQVERYEVYQPFATFQRHQPLQGWTDAETRANYEACRATWYALRSLASRLRSTSYELIAYGRREEYALLADAERVAANLNASASLRTAWGRGAYEGDRVQS